MMLPWYVLGIAVAFIMTVFFIVRKKQVANPKRCYSYAKGIIQNLIDSEEGKDK